MKQLLCLFFLFVGVSIYSQRTINGIVKNTKNEGLPFVSVVIKGTNKGTKTNDNGEYVLVVPDSNGVILKYSFIGFETQEIRIEKKSLINVTLEESVSLDEVVVVGYGTSTKKNLLEQLQKWVVRTSKK